MWSEYSDCMTTALYKAKTGVFLALMEVIVMCSEQPGRMLAMCDLKSIFVYVTLSFVQKL